ncbi:MAG TPA: site-2 protease family protein [Terriglobales bacterium]|nr:site-2 protease family protein [Terriglobales bacterium]HXY52253.1 site-2 protease family protein [Terriglobales bacterium]
MRSTVKLGKISGIEIGLHYSWFIIAALIVFSLGEHFHHVNPNWSMLQVRITALVTAALFFVTLLLHELAHSLVAQRRGLKISAITLFALGGVSQMQDDATDAKTEFWVAIAGPITSLLIGFGCRAIAGLGWRHSTEPHTVVTEVLVWLGYINIGLALFNMIPGFPLDGGRVLRSIIWGITKNADRSTRIAARVGQVVALLFILDGIWQFFSGAGFGGLWIAFIGWFLMDAAKASYAEVGTASALRGLRVSEVMSGDCVIVNHGMSLQEFVDIYLLTTGQRCFAVDDHGRLIGLVTLRDVTKIPRDRWERTTMSEAMRPLKELQTVSPDTPVLDALKLMVRNDVNQLPVVAYGSLQGIVSRSQILQLLQIRNELRLAAAYRPPSELSARNEMDVRTMSQMSSRHSRPS